jgi:hypothetical protein
MWVGSLNPLFLDANDKMTSRVNELELESIQAQIDLFNQMRHHLLFQMNRYHRQGKRELAKIIRDSFSDSLCPYND